MTMIKETVGVEEEVATLLGLYKQLSEKEDLSPCTGTNVLFGELVGLATKTLSKPVTRQVGKPPSSIQKIHDMLITIRYSRILKL